MADARALVAHLLRRTTFGPFPGQVEAMAARGVDAALQAVLSAAPLPSFALPPAREAADDVDLAGAWLAQMRSPQAGLHEKMTWFWHGHFTSGVDKVGQPMLLWKQQALLRRHALGSFRDLAQEVTVDPAMLQYLDGDGSTAEAPNENYARELMELFTIGRGHYTERDVRAGARALAGWSVDEGKAVFDEGSALLESVSFLGRSGRFRAREIVDIVCDRPECASFIAGKVYRYLVGVEAPAARRAELAERFRESGLRIGLLVEEVLRDPVFFESRLNRPRFPVEWVTAASAALGIASAVEACDAMGQVPFAPPNVAGWPPGERWLAVSAALARVSLALQAPALDPITQAQDPVQAALDRCSLHEVSDETREALAQASASVPDPGRRAAVVLGLAVASPEFALA